MNSLALNLIDKFSVAIGINHHPRRVWVPLDRTIIEADPQWRKKNEQQYERYHHVILDRTALVRPENETLDRAPQGTDRNRRRVSGCGIQMCIVEFDFAVLY